MLQFRFMVNCNIQPAAGFVDPSQVFFPILVGRAAQCHPQGPLPLPTERSYHHSQMPSRCSWCWLVPEDIWETMQPFGVYGNCNTPCAWVYSPQLESLFLYWWAGKLNVPTGSFALRDAITPLPNALQGEEPLLPI